MRVRPVRVLRIITRLNVGGPALHALLLTARLPPDRYESLLVSGQPGQREGDTLALRPELGEGVEGRLRHVPALGRVRSPWRDVAALRQLEAVIGTFQPDIVHTHTAKAGLLGRIAAIRHRVPIVVHTFHGTSFAGHYPAAVTPAAVAAERALARRTQRLVAVSDAVARDLVARKIARPDRIAVIPPGLDLRPFLSVPALRRDQRHVVMLVARLAPVKDIPLFFQVASLVRASIPDAEFRIAGDGPLRDRLERQAPPGTRFLGHQGDMASVLGAASVVVLTSRSEGTPIALIEALAAGRPVVAPPVGGIPDVLTGRAGAILTPDRSAPAIAAAIVDALTDPRVAAGAETGRDAVAQRFSADRLIRDIDQLYGSLAASGYRNDRGDADAG